MRRALFVKKFTFDRLYNSELDIPVWERTWNEPERNMSFASVALSKVRACSGLGVVSPFSISVSSHSVQTKTLTSGVTLAEWMNKGRRHCSTEVVRALCEQLCFGLHRLHEGLGQPYGAVYPYNVGWERTDERFFLWSAPTARLESEQTSPHELDPRWELPYEPPESDSQIETDLYGVGRLMLKLIPPSIFNKVEEGLRRPFDPRLRATASELSDIILVNLQRKREHRYRDAVSLARAVNPNTKLAQIDILGGLGLQKRALESFRDGMAERAEGLWQEALKRDWLSVALWNNSAVCRMRKERWGEAVDKLQKAYRIDASQPVVIANLAFCFAQLKEIEEAEKWARQAVAMRPDSPVGLIVLSNLSDLAGRPSVALHHASEAVAWNPQSASARRQYFRILERLGPAEQVHTERRQIEAPPQEEPFSEFLIDEMVEPPWGRIRRDEPEFPEDEDGYGGSSCREPRCPIPPRGGAKERIASSEYLRGMKED